MQIVQNYKTTIFIFLLISSFYGCGGGGGGGTNSLDQNSTNNPINLPISSPSISSKSKLTQSSTANSLPTSLASSSTSSMSNFSSASLTKNDETIRFSSTSASNLSSSSQSSSNKPSSSQSSSTALINNNSSMSSKSSTSNSSSSTKFATSCGVTYGARLLRTLTKEEYVNSIRDLTGIDIINDLGKSIYDGIPADNLINGFSNNGQAIIESGALQSYGLVASKIVDALSIKGFKESGIVDCATNVSGNECHSLLMDGFGVRVFRRPLTDAEHLAYLPIFSAEYTGGDLKEGIKLALRTMLTSPQFLYRSEVGVAVADLGNTLGSAPEYTTTGITQTFIENTSPKNIAIYGQTGTSANFVGNDLIQIEVKGTQSSSGLWPTLRIQVDQKTIVDILINHTYAKIYKFHVANVSGNKYTALINQQTGADLEYLGGQNLIITSYAISGAKEVVAEKPPVDLDNDAYVLTQYELASFLSFTFAGTTPDDILLTAAKNNALITNAQIENQVERLLKKSQARIHFGNFAAQWLNTDRVLTTPKDATLYPTFTPEVRSAMAQEIREVFNHVVLDEGEPFTKLYNGNFTFVNQALASFYDISGVTGTNMRKVNNVSSRAGLVTSGAFLSINAHEKDTAPILRAVYARRDFMCHFVPTPPTGISLNGTEADALREKAKVDWEAYLAAHNGKAPSRLKYEFQTSATLCQGCHKQMINPLGGGFEDFNAVGLPQNKDYNGLTVDFNGVLYGVNNPSDGLTLAFNGAKEFANNIADLDSTRTCFIDNSFRMAMGTGSRYYDLTKPSIALSESEIKNYSCDLNKLENIMKNSNNSTKALLKGLGSLDSVRYRKNITR